MNRNKYILAYALVFSLLSIILSILHREYFQGKIFEILSMVLSLFLMVFCISFGVFHIIKKQKNVSFSSMLKVGVSIAMVGALILASYQVIINYIDPKTIEESIALQLQKYKQYYPQTTEEQLIAVKDNMKESAKPLWQFSLLLMKNLFFGFIISLGTSAFIQLKNKK